MNKNFTNEYGHTIAQWYKIAQNCRLYRFHYSSKLVDYLQLKIDRNGEISVVQIQLYVGIRGQGRFAKFIEALKKIAPVNVECPQPRLKAWCESNGVPVT